MKKLLYAISLGLGFWYFMSPFLIKTAATLQGRAAGIFIGLVILSSSYIGFTKLSKKPAYGIACAGILSLIWALVGGKIMHYGGTFHGIILGLILLAVAWFITHTFKKEHIAYSKNGNPVEASELYFVDDELRLHSSDDQNISINSKDILGILGTLSYSDTKSLVASLWRTARKMRKEEKAAR